MIKQKASKFPTVYKSMDLKTLVKAYSRAPGLILKIIQNLDHHELNARPIPDKWSIQEIICHLTDSELIGAVRIQMTLSENNKDLPYYDQDIWARNLKYSEMNIDELIANINLFSAVRSKFTLRFEKLTSSEWKREGNHAEFGRITVRNLLELYADHSERHIEQILERKMLIGKPDFQEIILKKRLY